MIKDPVTLEEKMENIKELVHRYVPDVEVKWSTGYRTLGYYKPFGGENREDLICIDKYFADGNSWEVIEETVLHEIAHALTPGHKHDEIWAAKCVELGINPEQTSDGYFITKDNQKIKIRFKKNPPRNRKPEPDVCRYIEVCDKCGTLTGYGLRKTNKAWSHECGGTLQLLPNPLFNVADYDPDRIFDEMNEQLGSVISTNAHVLAIARLEYVWNIVKQNRLFVICDNIPAEDERRAMYKELDGLFEYAQINAGTDADTASDKLTVKRVQKETDIFYAVSDDLMDYIRDIINGKQFPKTDDLSIRNPACLEKAEVIFEKDDTWQKITSLIHSGTKELFRMICQSELHLAVSEEILNSLANKDCSGINDIKIRESCKHIIIAVYALNRRFCQTAGFDKDRVNTTDLERKPENFDLILASVLKNRFNKKFYPDSLEKILRLSMEIDSLSGAD